MLDCNRANVSSGVKVKQGVFIEITCLCYRRLAKLDKQRIGAGKVTNSHAWNRRSKNALLHCLTVRQQNHPKETIFHFGHSDPAPDTAIGLYLLADRRGYRPLNPFLANYRPIGSERMAAKYAVTFTAAI